MVAPEIRTCEGSNPQRLVLHRGRVFWFTGYPIPGVSYDTTGQASAVATRNGAGRAYPGMCGLRVLVIAEPPSWGCSQIGLFGQTMATARAPHQTVRRHERAVHACQGVFNCWHQSMMA